MIHGDARPPDGEVVNEQYVTEFFRASTVAERVGERAPDHRLEVDGEPWPRSSIRIADDQTARYADGVG